MSDALNQQEKNKIEEFEKQGTDYQIQMQHKIRLEINVSERK